MIFNNNNNSGSTLALVFGTVLIAAIVEPCASAVAGTSLCACPVTANLAPCNVTDLVAADGASTCSASLDENGNLNENVRVNSNPKVSAFNLDGVRSVSGFIWVEGNAALANISMPDLVSVGRYFKVKAHTAGAVLSTMSLPKLEIITEYFHVESNTELTALDVPELNSTGGDFFVNGLTHETLKNISFAGLKSVGGKFDVQVMGSTERMNFDSLETIGTDMNIRGNQEIVELSFSNLKLVGNALLLDNNAALVQASLSALGSVGGAFEVSSNAELISLSIASLTTVNGKFVVNSNPKLATLVGNCNAANTSEDGEAPSSISTPPHSHHVQ